MRKFIKNLLFAFGAQSIAMISSILISLVMPKILGVETFAYWQLFIFYSGYVIFFHFGLLDGLYLRYGGIRLADMNKRLIGSQIRFMSLWQIVISIILLCILPFFIHDEMRMYVWIMVCIYLVILNMMTGLSYMFQAGNETHLYSIANMISKVLFIVFILVSILIRNNNIKSFLVMYLTAHIAAVAFCVYHGREFIFSKWIDFKTLITETYQNMKIGINMTLSVIASSLILGFGRGFVDQHWNLKSFGVFSLAISLTNFGLMFIAQISMVMFPALRQAGSEKQLSIYSLLRGSIGILICGALVFFVPIKTVLMLWLPDYADSFSYLGILFPICVFDGKMQMLYNTYLKVFRKERVLLLINIVSCLFSLLLCLFSTYVLDSIVAVVYSMIIAIAVRSVIASCYLSKSMNISYEKNIIYEVILCAVFVLANQLSTPGVAFLIYFGFYILVVFMCRKDFMNVYKTLRNCSGNRK
jgi:O-antigen/teichoic acid export membrane protein